MTEQTELPSNKFPAYIFDVDGVLANNNHRQHIIQHEGSKTQAEWDKFFSLGSEDLPYSDTVLLLKTLQAAGNKILICTGRNEDWLGQLRTWLTDFGIFPDEIFMRRAKDFSKDWEVKKEIWQTQIRPFYKVLGVFEDRADCVAMWRSFGLTCYQPREANY
nr:MAG TPA: polynucleotide kinase [Caudoviricetes sp.]